VEEVGVRKHQPEGLRSKAADKASFLDVVHKFLILYRYMRKYSRQIQGHGIRGRQFSALRYLLDAGPLTIGQLRDYLYVSDSTTSELVSCLETAGYVTRTRCKRDNRVVFVDLTSLGREIAERAPLGGIPLLREKLKTLSSERLAVVDEALEQILTLMEIER
jgi:MarR family 2-MHQ and catechol resistance regulon transcriptional repressor